MKKSLKISLARAYELPRSAPGVRVLIDRLWPRGIKKADLKLDAWLKDVAPSPKLRKWFHADSEARFSEFKKHYTAELRRGSAELQTLLDIVREKPVLLIYGSRDEKHNHAIVLQGYLTKLATRRTGKSQGSG